MAGTAITSGKGVRFLDGLNSRQAVAASSSFLWIL
jgi:hypothetical protein